jgi:predicted ATP-grasp superfamily ATP-dependent carboligase
MHGAAGLGKGLDAAIKLQLGAKRWAVGVAREPLDRKARECGGRALMGAGESNGVLALHPRRPLSNFLTPSSEQWLPDLPTTRWGCDKPLIYRAFASLSSSLAWSVQVTSHRTGSKG